MINRDESVAASRKIEVCCVCVCVCANSLFVLLFLLNHSFVCMATGQVVLACCQSELTPKSVLWNIAYFSMWDRNVAYAYLTWIHISLIVYVGREDVQIKRDKIEILYYYYEEKPHYLCVYTPPHHWWMNKNEVIKEVAEEKTISFDSKNLRKILLLWN